MRKNKLKGMLLTMVNDLNDYSTKLSALSTDLLEYAVREDATPCELTCPKAEQCVRLGEGCINY